MAQARIYLDHNASAPLCAVAREAMIAALDGGANASSIHAEGRFARGIVEKARVQVAALARADPANVIFTSGASEAAMLALTPDQRLNGKARPAGALLRLTTEHPCVLNGGRFPADAVIDLPVNSDGLIDEDAFAETLRNHATPLVAIQLVNSETGIVQPVARIAEQVRARGGYVLCDAVQAAGRLPLSMTDLGVDYLLLSAHKIGGPQGAGALVLANATLEPAPLITGGAQENRRRAGTENVAAIAGFGAAAKIAAHQAVAYGEMMHSSAALPEKIRTICDMHGLNNCLHIFSERADSVPNTLCFALDGLEAQTALIDFDLQGIALSSGSACSSGKVGSSHVLKAMGVPEAIARCALRVSTGPSTTKADLDTFIAAFDRMAKRLAERTADAHMPDTRDAA